MEVDEAFFGSPRSGIWGRGALGKVMVVVSVEHAGSGELGQTRMQVIPNARASTLAGFLASAVEPGATVMTDGLLEYRTATTGYVHEIHVVHDSSSQAHELLPAVYGVISLTKSWIAATHQGGVQSEHLPAYVDEFVFKFNRRKSRVPGPIFYRLLQATLSAVLTEHEAPPRGPAAMAVRAKIAVGSHRVSSSLASSHGKLPGERVHQTDSPFSKRLGILDWPENALHRTHDVFGIDEPDAIFCLGVSAALRDPVRRIAPVITHHQVFTLGYLDRRETAPRTLSALAVELSFNERQVLENPGFFHRFTIAGELSRGGCAAFHDVSR